MSKLPNVREALKAASEMGADAQSVAAILSSISNPNAGRALGIGTLSAEGLAVMDEFRQTTYDAIQVKSPFNGNKPQPSPFVLRQLASIKGQTPEASALINEIADGFEIALAVAHNRLLATIEEVEKAFGVAPAKAA